MVDTTCWTYIHSRRNKQIWLREQPSELSFLRSDSVVMSGFYSGSETHTHKSRTEGRKCVPVFFGLHLSSIYWRLTTPEVIQLAGAQLSKVKTGPSSSSSPLLSTVCFSICQCEMNYATFFLILLIFLTCGLILLSVALFVQWHIKKKKKMERCFFYVKEQKAVLGFFSMCKSRVECWNIRLAEKIYFLPCQSDMQNVLFQKIF